MIFEFVESVKSAEFLFSEQQMTNFFDLAKQRRSIRAFESRPVEQEKVQKILETANAAPSAGNLQAYEIYLATSARDRAALARAALGQLFIASAPVVLVFCAHPARSAQRYGDRGTRLYALQDATIAVTYAMLAVADLGLASVWIGAFNDNAVWQAIGSPEGMIPVAVLPIGYAAEEPPKTARRRLDDLVHRL